MTDYLVSQDINILAFTETWRDSLAVLIYSTNRDVKDVMVIKPETMEIYNYFENMNCTITIDKITIKISIFNILLFLNKCHYNSLFFDNWSKCLDNITLIPYDVIITGYLYFLVDNKSDVEARAFCSILDSPRLIQHVNGATHKGDHTLDIS